jgi:hypothetical protein
VIELSLASGVTEPTGQGDGGGRCGQAGVRASDVTRPNTGRAAQRRKVLRGDNMGCAIRYLFGPGRHNEHTLPHLVAAWLDAPALQCP